MSTTVEYTGDQSTPVDITNVTAMSGTLDAGSLNSNTLVHFSITDMTPFTGDDGFVYVHLDSGSFNVRLANGSDQGLALTYDPDGNPGVEEDDFSWAGATGASVSGDPTVTINLTMAALGPPRSLRTGMDFGFGFTF